MSSKVIVGLGVAVAAVALAILWWRKQHSKPNKPVIAVLTANSQSGIGAIKQLLSKPDANTRIIRAIVRSKDKIASLKESIGFNASKHESLIEFVVGGDANAKHSLIKALKGSDAALLVTPTTADRGKLTCNMIRGAKDAGVKRIALGVSWTVACKLKLTDQDFGDSEALGAELFPHQVVYLRAGYFMSNFAGFAGAIKNLGKFFLPIDESVKMAIVNPDDIGAAGAEALIRELETPFTEVSKVVDVTGPEALTLDQVANKIGECIGKKVEFISVKLEAAVDGMKKSGRPDWEVDFVAAIIPFVNQGYIAQVSKDVEELTGKRSTFDEWLQANKSIFV